MNKQVKRRTDFQQEMKNSEQFLQKLQGLKQQSKDIKQRNKLTNHRNIWVKQCHYLNRLQRDAELQFNEIVNDIDKYYDIEQKYPLPVTKSKKVNFTTLKSQQQELFHDFSCQVYGQVQSIPLLLKKCHNQQEKTLNEVCSFFKDISEFLSQTETKVSQILTKLNIETQNIQKNSEEDNDEENVNLFINLKSIANQVKGFDFNGGRWSEIKAGQENLFQYLYSLNHKLSEDEISEVIMQYNQTSSLLNQAFELQLEKINLNYEEILELDEEMINSSNNFMKINHIYSTYIGRGKSVALYYERLMIQFPKIGRKMLEKITVYIEAKLYKEKKIKAVKRNYLRQREQILLKVQKQINIRIQNKIKTAQIQAQKLARKQQKLKLQQQLQILRTAYKQRQKYKQQQHLKSVQKAQQVEKKKQTLRKLYLQDLNKKVNQIHQIKQEKQKEAQKNKYDKKNKEQQQKKKKILQNKPKVNLRQNLDKNKLEKKLYNKEIRQKQQVYKKQRIHEAVQKYAFRPKIEPSQLRLNAPTEALIKKKQTKLDKADKVQLSKKTGYSVNQLMTDMRFKLNLALQEAGIANTQYARQVMVQMSYKPNNI